MKDKRNLIDSFNNAVNGIISALKTEKNLKVHFILAFLVLFYSLFTNLSKVEFLILMFTISLVIITEMLNTAIENLVDIETSQYHPLAKVAKDVSAGAVFMSALNAIVVAYIIFYDKLDYTVHNVFSKVKQVPTHITFIALFIVLIFTVALKAYFNKGTPFHGGMPSGHAAIAFATATAISFLSLDSTMATPITILCFILAILVAQSRIEGKIHNFFEVFFGGAVGMLITLFIFKIIM